MKNLDSIPKNLIKTHWNYLKMKQVINYLHQSWSFAKLNGHMLCPPSSEKIKGKSLVLMSILAVPKLFFASINFKEHLSTILGQVSFKKVSTQSRSRLYNKMVNLPCMRCQSTICALSKRKKQCKIIRLFTVTTRILPRHTFTKSVPMEKSK